MEYEIFQVKKSNPDGRMFMSYSWLTQHNLKVVAEVYDRVYSGEVESFEPLEYLWKKFNLAHPDDYRGRSLSVSDVVVLTDEGGTKAFFCDSFGWKELKDAAFTTKYEIKKLGTIDLHVCPNHCEALLVTTAHVAQTWKVDATGNFVDEVSTDDIDAGPDNDNIWTCEECGAEAELVPCTKFSILACGEPQGALYIPETPRGCAFWISHGLTAPTYIPIVPDTRDIPTLTVEGRTYFLSDFSNA